MNIALIVAGGYGLRMKKSQPKQYLNLADKPIIAHTLLAFEGCRHINGIILVLPLQDINMVTQNILPLIKLTKPIRLVPGGEQRQDSVFNGLQHIDSQCQIVVIHDGVRPFVSPTQISDCILMAKENDACILGIPAYDTLKRVTRNGKIEVTLDRKPIWLAQTPQAFKIDLIKKAHLDARKDNILETDDAALVERLGIPVKIIAGSRKNIKITTFEDLELCETLISSQRDGY